MASTSTFASLIPRPPRTPSPPNPIIAVDDHDLDVYRRQQSQLLGDSPGAAAASAAPQILEPESDLQPLADRPHWLAPESSPSRGSNRPEQQLRHQSSAHLLRPPDMAAAVPGDDALISAPASAPPPATDGGGVPIMAAPRNPFNFQTQVISTSPVKSNIGQRRGHRYKHSSISTQHQIFQEPPPRPPPVLPASLPVPTIREAWKSMQQEQRLRLYWCLCHVAVAVFVFFRSEGSLALTAVSHLVFFDAGSAAVCVAVDVLGNFEVWRRSSIRHPFGLERAEVLAGFAMSVFLLFGGFDLVSHNLKHMLENVGGHAPHHDHTHAGHGHGHAAGSHRVSAGSVDWASVAAIASTLVSAYGLHNHTRIARVMRVSYLADMPSILSNPFHFLTLSFSSLLLLLPLLSVSYYIWLDRLICAAVAASMFALGFRLAVAQALMLIMSYAGGSDGSKSVSAVLREIEAEPNVTRVDDAQFWQVHYGLGMANLKLCVVKGTDEGTLSKLRNRISTLVQNRLGEGYGHGNNLRWEVTLQLSMDPS